ncbi:MAG: toll/interleukin-1 receptor domain-containing protein [Bacteroidales bacterium]|nr:toll/interleukin-1 receptor domain-containing protein [Bacteroidales bacterium]
MSTPLERIKKKIHIVEFHDTVDKSNNEELVNEIVQLTISKALVPVVCEDMFEYVNPDTKERQSLQSYIVEHIITNHPTGYFTEKEVQDMLNGGYAGMRLLCNKYRHQDFYKYVNKAVHDSTNKIREGIGLKEEVRDFLIKGQFPLIITTSCFQILETVLDGYTARIYKLNSKNGDPVINNSVYHIFGESTLSRPESCGIEERNILHYLKSLYSTDFAPKDLLSCLDNNQNRGILFFLGSNAPDWLFRFMLLPMYPAELYQQGSGFYLNENHRIDEHLERFLKDISFEKEDEMMEILKKVISKLPSSHQDHISHNKKFDFFLSYASEDKEYAKQLKDILDNHGLNVWFDRSNIDDGDYWERIIKGMEDSAIFLPLVSASYIEKVTSKKKRNQVLQKHGLETLPHDPQKCWNVNHDKEMRLSGVQVELLLAESQYRNQDVRSIPVILSDEVIDNPDEDREIDQTYIENLGAESRRLPEILFKGIQMYEFDRNNPSSFVLKWDRYKGNK